MFGIYSDLFSYAMWGIRLGDDVDDFCTKCKRLTNHAILSIVGDQPAKVRCRTCYHEQDFRNGIAPPSKKDLKKAELFNRRLFSEFVDFYLEKFAELCAWIEEGAHDRKRRIKVFLPSTVFIDERPRGMTEYAMAKAAAEILAADLNAHLENVTIVSTRLPRMPTDQTSSIAPIRTVSAIEALLPVVREMQT